MSQDDYTTISWVLYKIPLIVVIFAGIYIVRKFVFHVCKSTARLDGKTVIVTGCTSGIGKTLAYELVRRGARVILACRDVLQGENVGAGIVDETRSKNLVIQRLDLNSLHSIRHFVDRVVSQEKRLDILINNAGVMWCPQSRTGDGFETHLATNHLGHFLLTNLLLDLLKKSAPSRVITVTSSDYMNGEIHFDNINLDGVYTGPKAYSQSKLANVLFAKELGRRMAGTGVFSLIADPGYVSTNIVRHLSFVLRLVLRPFMFVFFRTPWEGAQTIMHCALMDTTSSMRDGQADYYSNCELKTTTREANDHQKARQLWEMSSSMVGRL